jgi:hypothetical protein
VDIAADAIKPVCHSCVRRPARLTFGTVDVMGGNAVLVWIMLGVAVVVLVVIALYVDSWRRKDDA